MATIDAGVNTSIFRKNHPMIIALRRDLAQVSPIRLKNDSAGYLAGQVLSLNTVTGLHEKYSAASGTYGANCVLMNDVSEEDAATGTKLAAALFAGFLYADKLIDLSSNAKTNLGGRVYQDASLTNIFKF